MAKKGKYKGSSIKRGNIVEMYGVSDLLQKIEKAGGKVDAAVQKAADASLEQVGMKMQLFMLGHRRTGDTYRSFEQLPATINNGKVDGFVGYNIDKGGLPAIFLDVGRKVDGDQVQNGKFFRYYAVENSRKQIEQIQRDTLNEILEGLK